MDSQDVLGLEKPIKLGRVSRIPKITDDLLFDNIRGLPQIRKNHTKLSALLRKLDRSYTNKIKKGSSKASVRQAKLACETEKLQKVLLFYQLWCHGLFPRANFKDCVQMLRNYTSFPLKEYRCGILNDEIHRLKVEKGIITEDPDDHPPELDEDDLYLAPVQASMEDQVQNSNLVQDDEDDWGFLSVNRQAPNQLFVDDIGDDEPAISAFTNKRIVIEDDEEEPNYNDNQCGVEEEDEEGLNDEIPDIAGLDMLAQS